LLSILVHLIKNDCKRKHYAQMDKGDGDNNHQYHFGSFKNESTYL